MLVVVTLFCGPYRAFVPFVLLEPIARPIIRAIPPPGLVDSATWIERVIEVLEKELRLFAGRAGGLSSVWYGVGKLDMVDQFIEGFDVFWDGPVLKDTCQLALILVDDSAEPVDEVVLGSRREFWGRGVGSEFQFLFLVGKDSIVGPRFGYSERRAHGQ